MNSLFNNKPFDEIDYDDIVKLVEQRIPESLILDYKGDILQTGKLLKASEFGKDVSAFANTFGGWIIYGIATDEKDEIKPLEKDAIVGIEDKPALKESIENKILSSTVPKPLYRIKKIAIPDTDRCVILVYIPQSYNYVHMVSSKGEYRFYKRYEYSSIPMDYYEIKNRFEAIGQTEEVRRTYVAELIEGVSRHVQNVSKDNLFCIASIPKFLIPDHFNDKQLIQKVVDKNRENSIIREGRMPQRRSNRFYTELVFNGTDRVATLNYFYNGIVIQVMPIDLYKNDRVNASALYYDIYYFINLLISYYATFDFQGMIDLRFDLKGITGKELGFISKRDRYFPRCNFIFDEEIDTQVLTSDIADLETQKVELSKSLVQPLFYGIDIDVTLGLCDKEGKPLYWQ